MPVKQLQRLRQRFHEIARHNGSHASWLPEADFLVTADAAAPDRELPYEAWLLQALQATGHSVRVLPPNA